MSIFLRWGVPAFVTVVVGTTAAVSTSGAAIPSDLAERTRGVLGASSNWATVTFDARDARITGTAGSPETVDEAVARIAAVPGVRSVTPDVVIAKSLAPFPFMATIQDGQLTLSGGLPDEAARLELLAAAGSAVVDELVLAAGVPDRADWLAAARYALTIADALDEGEVALSDLDLTISGSARSSETYARVQQVREQGTPSGVSLAYLEVQPPLLSPFEWRAEYDGRRLTLSGAVPSESVAEAQRTFVAAGVDVSQSLVVASGAPSDFASTASLLLENLLKLQSGSAEISDATSTLSGLPSGPDVVESVLLAMAPAATTVQLEAPAIDEYWFTARRDGEQTVLDGFIPDRAMRDRLDAMIEVDAQSLEIGRGAPERFESGVDFLIGLLEQMSEGQAELRGTVVTFEGRAATVADYEAATNKLSLGAPQGLLLATATIKPPLAAPFTFAATKTEEGGYALSGYVPSKEALGRFVAALPEPPAGEPVVADGHPSDFELAAIRALSVLRLLDSGEIAFDGANWSLTGAVDSAQKASAAEAAFASTGLRTAGWTYSVAVPSGEVADQPLVEPYTWQAVKSADGGIEISGYVPGEQLKRHLALTAGTAVTDGSELAAGAPEGFAADAAAGLSALLELDEGALTLTGTDWSLIGSAGTAEQSTRLEAALRSAIVMPDWRIELTAPEAPASMAEQPSTLELAPAATEEPASATPELSGPVERYFIFEATKVKGGPVAFRGRVPAEPVRQSLAVITGGVPSEDLSIGDSLPTTFSPSAEAGSRALALLVDGHLGLDGETWVISGRAESEATLQVALAEIASAPGRDRWETDLTLLPPLELCQDKIAALAARNAILFESGSARIAEASLGAIDELAAYLELCPGASIEVEGHTDSDGDDQANLALSVFRAEAVVDALVMRGVGPERLYAIGYGESLPVESNDTTAGKQANRRIAFTVSGQ